jgi:hypothetical protein
LSGGVKAKATEPEKKAVSDFFNELEGKEKV